MFAGKVLINLNVVSVKSIIAYHISYRKSFSFLWLKMFYNVLVRCINVDHDNECERSYEIVFYVSFVSDNYFVQDEFIQVCISC